MNLLHIWSRNFLNCFCAGSRWVSLHVSSWKSCLSAQIFGSSGHKPHWFSRPDILRGLSLWDKSQELGCLMWDRNSLLLWGMLCVCEISSHCGSLCWGDFGETTFLLLLPILMWPFILYCGRASCQSRFKVFFRGIWSMCIVAVDLVCPWRRWV